MVRILSSTVGEQWQGCVEDVVDVLCVCVCVEGGWFEGMFL